MKIQHRPAVTPYQHELPFGGPPKQPDTPQDGFAPRELHPIQVLGVTVPRVAVGAAVGAGAGALLSSIPSIAETAAPGVGYLATGLLGVMTVAGGSAGLGFSAGLGGVMFLGLGAATVACYHNAAAVGQALMSPVAVGLVGAAAGMAWGIAAMVRKSSQE